MFAPETHTPQGFPDHNTQTTPPKTLTQQGFASTEHMFAAGGGGVTRKIGEGAYSHILSVKIDAIGLGWGVVGLLEAWGREGLHGARIVGVNVAERAFDAGKFKNQRAEMWWNGRVLLQPDDDGFQLVKLDVDRRVCSQLALPDYVSDSSGRIKVISKEELKRKGMGSPDRAEAVLLALYEPKGDGGVPLVAPVVIGQANVWNL